MVPSDTLLEAIAACAVEVTGFSRDAIGARALKQVVTDALRDGLLAADLLSAARARSATVVGRVIEAVAVSETYFFRNVEQLETVIDAVLADPARGERPIRVWCAGCSTGEEAWSIAALLRERRAASSGFEVVATDLLPSNVAAARIGEYGRWSVRQSGRGPASAYVTLPSGRVRVDDALRAHVRFEVANLLDAPPPGVFDLVACRNVLVYFADEPRRRVLARFQEVLRSGGLLALGAMDAEGVPEGFAREGPTEQQVFRRITAGPPVVVPKPPRPKPPLRGVPIRPFSPPPRAAVLPTDRPVSRVQAEAQVPPLLRHIEALMLVDRGAQAEARVVLEELAESDPTYIPGIFELALLLARDGEQDRHLGFARRVVTLAGRLPPDAVVEGPEPLAAEFYVDAAARVLDRHGSAR